MCDTKSIGGGNDIGEKPIVMPYTIYKIALQVHQNAERQKNTLDQNTITRLCYFGFGTGLKDW